MAAFSSETPFSSEKIKTCGKCNGSLAGQAFFTAVCSHTFHFPCLSSHPNSLFRCAFCPTCNASWNHPSNPQNPFSNPPPSNPQNPFSNPPPSNPQNPFSNPPPSNPQNPFSNPPPSNPQNPFSNPPSNPQNPFSNPPPSNPQNPFSNPPPSNYSSHFGHYSNHFGQIYVDPFNTFQSSFQNPPQPLFRRNSFQNPSHPLFHHNTFYTSFHHDDPLRFSDDEPLVVVDPTSRVSSTKVAIKAVPERPAVAASESVSLFTLHVGLKGPPLSEDAQRAPIDIVTVLDVSGSMRGQKLDLVKKAVHFVIDNLGVSDRLSIVAFSDEAKRLLPLRRMTENGCEDAHKAVDKLDIICGTNIVKGLVKGVKVLDERRERNPVSSIIFLSDGVDSYNSNRPSVIVNQLPALINPVDRGELNTIPVHSFGFGSDHDPVTMHGISDASGGTFSFIGSIEMVQDAFAGCIGGLLSVVSQEVRLNLRSASHGVEIKAIPSGRYSAEIKNQGSEAVVKIGDLYADEGKEFLINLSVPKNEGERNTTLLDISCSYKDTVSKVLVQVEGDLVEIRRPEMVVPEDMVINIEVDRERIRVDAAESIKEAQRMAETGDLEGATKLLAKKREEILGSASAKAGDSLCLWLAAEMKETEMLMGSSRVYQESGRAFALAGMSSHAAQRATTRVGSGFGALMGGMAPGCSAPCGGFGGYVTPNMASMVNKSQQQNKKD